MRARFYLSRLIAAVAAPMRLVCLAVIFFAPAVPAQSSSRHLLAGYSFDDQAPNAGPDTFQIFRNGQGEVSLSGEYRLSGYRSIQIRDVANDGDFPELQGYFKALDSGILYFHFAFMLIDAEARFNIALAGSSHFRMKKHGIGFWLENDGGILRHHSGHAPRPLFELTPFTWYIVDLVYEIKRGRYDLTIRDEYGNDLVKLKNQANAVNAPGSTVDKFSFIGDLEDRENAHYFVDDITVHSSQRLQQPDFVAPGRRKLFVDTWNDYHKQLYGSIQCIPAVSSRDFGIDADVYLEIAEQGYLESLNRLLGDNPAKLPDKAGNWRQNPYLKALADWRFGCQALKKKDWATAVEKFESASTLIPGARLNPLSLALSHAGAGHYPQADPLMASLQPDWINDQRFAVAQAMIGLRRQALERAEYWLQQPAAEVPDGTILGRLSAESLNRNMIEELKAYDPDNWPGYLEQAVINEQYYFALLWQKRYTEALSYVDRIIARLDKQGIRSGKWLERAGDAAFYGKHYDTAVSYYGEALETDGHCDCIDLKLSDIYFLLGDAAKERQHREAVYGHLREAGFSPL